MSETLPQGKSTQQTKYATHQSLCESLDNLLKEGIFRSTPERGVLYANNTLIQMLGYTSLEELAAVPSDAFYADEECRTYLKDKIKAEGLILDYRVLYRRKDGSNFWGLLTVKKVMREGTTVYEGRVHDISNQVQTEERLKESQIRFEKLNMELDRFIYSASHDIRAPLASIMGIINLMRMDMQGEEAKKYFDMMDTSLAKLDHFVHELTGYAKNSKKAIDDERIGFDLLLNNLLNEFKMHHPFFGLIIWSVEVYDVNAFYSDRDRISLVLSNTIKNALDYCDQQKSRKIISVRVQTEPNKATIEIFDNGIGISSLHLEHVFDMFYRGTNFSKGPGLGLYTAREALTKLGGIISLSSEYGVGTSLKIEIPNSRKGKLINKKNTLRAVK